MTPRDRNPQRQPMADPSMVRTLSFQARAIWPQERRLFERYGLADDVAIVDVGCGTGEIAARLLELYPRARLQGIDIEPANLEQARARLARFGDRAVVRSGDAFDLDVADDSVDLAVCRHLLQAVPEPEQVVAELKRVTRPGGRVHLLAEDYGMMHFSSTRLDADRFWREGAIAFGEATGTDLRSGRKMFTAMARLGLRDIAVDYVTVDTLRVPREVFAGIWEAWRDGYADVIAAHTNLTGEEARAFFDDMIACIRSPEGYAIWQVPIVTGRA